MLDLLLIFALIETNIKTQEGSLERATKYIHITPKSHVIFLLCLCEFKSLPFQGVQI